MANLQISLLLASTVAAFVVLCLLLGRKPFAATLVLLLLAGCQVANAYAAFLDGLWTDGHTINLVLMLALLVVLMRLAAINTEAELRIKGV